MPQNPPRFAANTDPLPSNPFDFTTSTCSMPPNPSSFAASTGLLPTQSRLNVPPAPISTEKPVSGKLVDRRKSMAATRTENHSDSDTSSTRNGFVKILTPNELNYRSVCSTLAAQSATRHSPLHQPNRVNASSGRFTPYVYNYINYNRGPSDPNIQSTHTIKHTTTTQSEKCTLTDTNAAQTSAPDEPQFCIVMSNSTLDPNQKSLIIKDGNIVIDVENTSLKVLDELRKVINHKNTVEKLLGAFQIKKPDARARATLERLIHPTMLKEFKC